MVQEKSAESIRILVVEDFQAETEALVRELIDAELPHEIVVVTSEKDYKEEIGSFSPNIILSPYSLEKTNAVKLLGIARSQGSDAPFILLAFDLSEDIAIDLLAEGIEDYVLRSTVKRLPVAIRKALQRYKNQLDLKLSELRLRSSEEALRNMVREAPIAVAMFDMNMNYLVVSETWLNHENKSEHELIGKNHYDVVPEIPDNWKKFHQECLSGATHESEKEQFVRLDGRNQVLRWKMNPWHGADGEIGGAVLFIEDISEKIATQIELERSAASLSEAQKLAQIGSWELDVETRDIRWSDEMYSIHGLKKQPATIELFMQVIHPEDVDEVNESVNKAYTGINTPITYRVIRADTGEERTMYGSGAKLIGKKLIGTVQDITARHKMQSALKESESVFRELTENIEEVFWLTSKTGEELLYMSPLYEKVYGKSLDSVYKDGDSWSDNIHPEDKARVFKAFRKKGELGEYDEKYRLVHSDGTVKWVHARAFPIQDESGNVVRLAGLTQDITKQKKNKDLIETLSLVAKETINGVLIHDHEGKVTWANNGFKHITGYDFKDVKGLEPWSLVAGPDTNQKLIELTYKKVLAGKSFTSENMLYRKDGTKVWVTTTFTPILNDQGNIAKIVSIGTDISKHKELEALQRNMVKQLESNVSERTQALEQINSELRKEVWEKQQLSDELYHSNLDLKDSIQYAKRIQESILPQIRTMRKSFSDLFVFFHPRDVVSGDLYWHYKKDDLTYLAVIDCTGHGVPGALMSMIANELMNQVIILGKMTDPGRIFQMLNKLMVRTLRQKRGNTIIQDGMDLGLCVIDHASDTL
ncbi:MAG: PAS domain S-box protein, partial [Flavobacteriales bacterium]|nr:PAS domain S-box protein [Flavobacteriales bacterium]